MKKISLLLAGILLLLPCISVSADAVPALEDRKGSLVIQCESVDGDKTTKIDGMELAVTRVASVNVDPTLAYYYTLLDDYAESSLVFEGMTASESNEAAKTLAALQDQKGLLGTKKVTAKDGTVSFPDLELGMYLVRQTGRSGTAADYTTIDPFLVMVPMMGDAGAWVYDVTTNPKTTPKKVITPIPTTTVTVTPPGRRTTVTPPGRTTVVKTGDTNQTALLAGIFLVSVAVLAGLFICRRKKN